jgi:ABC-type molybdenum transport system ATPase subunit/photorepair protein PhrA
MIIDDAINGVEVLEFFYLQSLRKIMGQYDFTVVVIVTHNCVEFLENSKLYQYLGMRVANAQRD